MGRRPPAAGPRSSGRPRSSGWSIKLPQEWWIHVAQLDFTDEFGKLGPTTHPWVWGRPRRSSRSCWSSSADAWSGACRPPDWPFTVDADVVAARVGWVPRGPVAWRAAGHRAPAREDRAGRPGHADPVRVVARCSDARLSVVVARRHGDGAAFTRGWRCGGADGRSAPRTSASGRDQHRDQRRRDAACSRRSPPGSVGPVSVGDVLLFAYVVALVVTLYDRYSARREACETPVGADARLTRS